MEAARRVCLLEIQGHDKKKNDTGHDDVEEDEEEPTAPKRDTY